MSWCARRWSPSAVRGDAPSARGFRDGALLALVVAAAWGGAVFATHGTGADGVARRVAPVPTAAALDSATLPLRGELTTSARVQLRKFTGDRAAILVLLDSADIRVCEDLGRQLRELRNRVGSTFPLVIVADSAALVRCAPSHGESACGPPVSRCSTPATYSTARRGFPHPPHSSSIAAAPPRRA
jgi:hypothetical protein